MTKEQKIDVIKKTEIFKNLGDEDFSHIADVAKELSYKSGDMIFEENSNADGFFIIAEGEVEILKSGEYSLAETLAVKTGGDVFGEMAIIDDLPRSASTRARTDTLILKLSKDIFNELLKSFPHLAIEISRNICSNVRATNSNYIRDLEKRNRQLKNAYNKLKKTQNELIQAEKLSLVGKFSSIIIHDIKNPLSNIRAYAELVRMSADDMAKVNKSANVIIEEVDRLNNMASELLEFSRGELQLNKTPINLSSYMVNMTDLIKENLKKQNITVNLSEKEDAMVMADTEKLKRVFLNLASNASDAMMSGGKINIKIIQDGNWVKWTMQDNGFGMDEEVLNRIFEPFYSYNKKSGTGLGMTIVKNIIERHGGYIKCISKKNYGTRFDIFLPKA